MATSRVVGITAEGCSIPVRLMIRGILPGPPITMVVMDGMGILAFEVDDG
jgi:Fe2+ transport system protein FeoA